MIPEHVIRLAHGPVLMHAGTRDAKLVPAHHVLGALRVDDDRRTVTVVVCGPTAVGLRENLADNGQIAVTFGHQPSHETYQLKGKALEVRDATDADIAMVKAWLEAMKVHDRDDLGAPPEQLAVYDHVILRGAVTVRLRVDAVFDQTPGPKAGQPVPAA